MDEPSLAAEPQPPLVLLPALVGAALALGTAGALIVYKASGGLGALAAAQRTGSLSAKARWIPIASLPHWAAPVADTANYFVWIAIALTFGIAIGAIVRAALPARWLTGALSRGGPWGLVLGAAIGAPLMLCSCCVSPVFDGAYARTRKLGPSLALMLAAPGLNPVDLAVTFAIFPRGIAVVRLACALVLVFGAAALVGRMAMPAAPSPAPCAVDGPAFTWGGFGASLLAALADSARRALPAVAVGALLSAVIAQALPLGTLAAGHGHAALLVLAAALLATPLALPTFAEIPIALALRAAGAPAGVAVAVLVAGPLVNLPSLFLLRRATSWRVAAATAAAVLLVAFAGGALANGFVGAAA